MHSNAQSLSKSQHYNGKKTQSMPVSVSHRYSKRQSMVHSNAQSQSMSQHYRKRQSHSVPRLPSSFAPTSPPSARSIQRSFSRSYFSHMSMPQGTHSQRRTRSLSVQLQPSSSAPTSPPSARSILRPTGTFQFLPSHPWSYIPLISSCGVLSEC